VTTETEGTALPNASRVLTRVRAVAKDERVVYLATGVFNTAFAFGLFSALELTVGDHVHYLLILLFTHVVGVLEAFTMYRFRVFKVKGNVLLDLARFESVNLVALAANVAMLPLLVEVLGLRVIPAQVVIICIVSGATFLAHKHFSFRRSAPQA
jgi:putative flippase GtrA